MDKSVLVIETPENCYDCPIGQDCSNILETSLFCLGAGKCVIDKEAATIPNWCPLKPLPERHIAPKTATGYEIGYEDGWNECLEKIMRGERFEKLGKILGYQCIRNHKVIPPTHMAEIELPECGTCKLIWECTNGYEYVAVSPQDPGSQNKYLYPMWNDMCVLKDVFFGDEEVKYKYSSKKFRYVNGVEGWMYLWRPIGYEIDELIKRVMNL